MPYYSRSYNPGAGGPVQHSPTKTKTPSYKSDGPAEKKKKDITDRWLGLRIIKGAGEALEKRAYASNLKSRKKFVKKQGLTKDDIRMDDDYLGSKTGLAELKRQGYKTNQDIIAESQLREGPTPGVKKVVGGRTILAAAPTEAEVSQSDAANAAETKLTKRRVKARGRKMNIYAQSKDKLTLGKKSLLGMV